jgi:hypothetical protein
MLPLLFVLIASYNIPLGNLAIPSIFEDYNYNSVFSDEKVSSSSIENSSLEAGTSEPTPMYDFSSSEEDDGRATFMMYKQIFENEASNQMDGATHYCCFQLGYYTSYHWSKNFTNCEPPNSLVKILTPYVPNISKTREINCNYIILVNKPSVSNKFHIILNYSTS